MNFPEPFPEFTLTSAIEKVEKEIYANMNWTFCMHQYRQNENRDKEMFINHSTPPYIQHPILILSKIEINVKN